MKVLLVDDASVLKQAKVFLEDEDERLDIDTATSAEEGLQKLSKNDYDAIVSDYQMPEMDGLEFLKTVREKRNDDIPFIIFTGKGREEVAIEALNLGADRYLQKGGDPKSQYSVLARAIVQEVEHSKAEEALQESEERFRTIFENKGTATGIVREDGVIRQCNAAFAELVGYSKSDLTGKMKWSDFVVKEDLERVQQYNKQRFEKDGTTPTQYECSIVNKNGDVRTVVVRVAMQEEDLIVSLLDITERKETEEELRKVSSVVSQSAEAIIRTDTDFRITYMNSASEKMYGYSQEKVEGKTPGIFNAEPESEKIQEDIYDTVSSGKTYKNVLLNRRKDGSKFHCEMKISPIFDNGEIVGFVSSQRDITEWKKAEENLKRYKKAVQSSDDSIYMVDKDYRYVFANEEHTSRLFDDGKIPSCNKDEVVGKKYAEIHSDEETDALKDNMGRVLEKGKPITEEYEFNTVDRWSSRTYSPVKGHESGEIEGIIIVSEDITERKEAEEREDFLSTLLRQDLRSKCQSIQGYLQLLGRADLSENFGEYLDGALEDAAATGEILELARKINKIEGREWVSDKDIVKVLGEAMDDVSYLVDREGVEIEENYPEKIGNVKGNYSLKTLFSEILKTRIRVTDCGEIRIVAEESEKEILVRIDDDGESLPGEVKDLFSGKVYTGKTTGVGGVRYYMIGRIAENNDARLEVGDSKLDGARFDIHLRKA